MAAHRRLVAVMFTDLVEFTTLSQQDEASTLAILGEHRSIVRDALVRHSGREVKTTGDGFLVEFESALEAAECAVEIQERSQQWRAAASGERPFVRIGIHAGDVMRIEGDILGDAVNIASRIEALADPGGICVSGSVYDQVANKVPQRFERLPTPVLKGVHTPVEVYRLLRAGAELGRGHRVPATNRIAVLPLRSISPDPQDEYLADGLTDELINSISRTGVLQAIARSSVDYVHAHARPVPQIGVELNVRSILEGSVRRSGNRIRVTLQLTDVPTQTPVWTHQYDWELDDVLAMQSEIALQVSETLRVEMSPGTGRASPQRPPPNTASYLAYLKGRTRLRDLSLPSAEDAYRQFEEATRLDPSNARAYTGMADAAYQRVMLSGAPFARVLETLAECKGLVTKSLSLDPNVAESHASLAHFLDELYEFTAAERELKAALSLNPTLGSALRWYARLLTEKGRLPEALEQLRIATEADPLSSEIQSILARTLLALGRLDEAEARIRRLSELEPDSMRVHFARFEQALGTRDRSAELREVEWFSVHDPNGTEVERRAYWFGIHHALSGERAGAREAIETLRRVRSEGRGQLLEWADELQAELHAYLGDLDACFALLRSALSSRALSLELWQTRSTLAPVRQDPRFQALLREAQLV